MVTIKHIPGQYHSLHTRVWLGEPIHESTIALTLSSHILTLVCVPPLHVTEHCDHALQVVHRFSKSMIKLVVNIQFKMHITIYRYLYIATT